ncbi:MAG: PIN domain-containing protein [Cyanobacteriota bacterium]|nr:PIN domain-containing protein [Cyanobacteriota bacterium]
MTHYLDSLFARYCQKGILVDTNILLLLFVGTVNRKRISLFKRTQQFVSEDYDLLSNILSKFVAVVTTPNILTEVNSLINQLGEPERSQCLQLLAKTIEEEGLSEFYVESRLVAQESNISKYGLTDSGIVHLAKNKYLVLTDDFKLANYLNKSEIDVINFNNLRDFE